MIEDNKKEFRLGNYVYAHSQNPPQTKYLATITSIADYGIGYKYDGPNLNHCTFSPIEITEEWLEKLGFVRQDKYSLYHPGTMALEVVEKLSNTGWFTACTRKDKTGMRFILIDRLLYIHQLQNLYFALTGEELIYQLGD